MSALESALASGSAASRPRRRWLRFSLRTFLLVLTALCIWLGVKVNQARRQKAAVEALTRLGDVFYAHQLSRDLEYFDVYDPQKDLGVPTWLRELAGDDFFQSVAAVDFKAHVTDANLVHLAALRELKRLFFIADAKEVTDVGLANLPRPQPLVYFRASGTSVGDEFVKRLAGSKRLETLGIS